MQWISVDSDVARNAAGGSEAATGTTPDVCLEKCSFSKDSTITAIYYTLLRLFCTCPQHSSHLSSKVLLRRISLLITRSILVHRRLRSVRILLEVLNLLGIHMRRNVICLPLLEVEAQTLVRVVLVVCLVLVVLDLDEVGVDGVGIEGEGDDGVDCGGLGDDLECP